jgi:predicted nucleic acid-binding protein
MIDSYGVLDTSVVIDLSKLSEKGLPTHATVSAVTIAELSGGLHTTNNPEERAARAERLQNVEAKLDPLPFDSNAARRYGLLVALVLARGRNPRPRRLDLMIAATAAANNLPLYTRNPTDFEGLGAAVKIIPVGLNTQPCISP